MSEERGADSGPAGEDRPPADAVADALLGWYRPRARDVPWRHEREPYRVWVGEVMAQQTRLTRVRRYYGPFLERFPDVESLAAASLDEVLKAWEGLGYYARARNLHRAARRLVSETGGRLPEDPEELRRLPGVGRYTAGAVASLAFGRAEPAVDANARRVLCRLYDVEEPGPARLEALAGELLASRPDRAESLNQALMDLGSEICAPEEPACDICPLEPHCLARRRGTVGLRPPRSPARELPHHDVGVGVVWEDGRLLIARRPPEGLLGGLWEFPGGKLEEGESPAEAIRRELREELGVEVEVGRLLRRVPHAYSHLRVTLHAHRARLAPDSPAPRAGVPWRWVPPEELDGFAFPAANVRIIEAIRESAGRGSGSPGA